ncbi:hypothetical protein BD289DRAFT_419848 [Coniella lustricola]|uniref:Microbial-type PARG catalytic domain-containing protein n=1 Tax=Coniella lustricola TaxID=2025994 RepID=A0A2T3ANP4_9PEZI|nr:hypothetical protein BD289DRAFT_419848 [Coniella lustricola]
MGRTEPTVVRAPPAFRRDARAKKAKATINKLIPSLLSAHPRAKRGIQASELIVRPYGEPSATASASISNPAKSSASSQDLARPRLTVRTVDTLTAAHSLLHSLENTTDRVAVLNMASPLSPGGGFLNGATSQEEFLCMRTTLLPALRDEFYRLPEIGCVYTPDVLVFRTSEDGSSGGADSGENHNNDLLDKKDRWFVDVVSAAMLRLPETYVDEATGHGTYVHAKDREAVVDNMNAVMRVFQAKNAAKVVVGAWGCGAYGNPVGEIARAWRKVLLGNDSKRASKKTKKSVTQKPWTGIQEVVFAVKDATMAEALQTAFGAELEWADEEKNADSDEDADHERAKAEAEAHELVQRIRDLEIRIERAPNARVKEGLAAVLAGLQTQRAQTAGGGEESDNED